MEDTGQKIRTFIALTLPEGTLQGVGTLLNQLQKTGAAVSWVKPDRIHLTLKFLGNVSSGQIEDIKDVLKKVAASTSCFSLQPSGCGAFPSLKQLRVVWVGLRGDGEALENLQRKVEEALIPFGFKPENRPFRPHLTVGRVRGKKGARSLQELLVANQRFEAEAFDVVELVLYKSELRPEGARYTPLFRAAFNVAGTE